MASDPEVAVELARKAQRIGVEVAGPAADDVDRLARFPSEAVDALRAEGFMDALVPTELGGRGASVDAVAGAVSALGRHCASTAMIYAMHLMQLACLVRHGRSAAHRDYLRELSTGQLLLASATTEIGVGGDIRTSLCAVERSDGHFRLEKQAPVISYGEQADAVLVTARRNPDSAPNDQVLVLCRREGLKLEPVSGWDTLGFRGTCSLGFRLIAEGEESAVLDDPFAQISSRTMLPISHVLWSSVWLGIAAAAVEKAGRYVRGEARKQPGTAPPSALRLAELMLQHQQLKDLVGGAVREYESRYDNPEALMAMNFAVSMNSLKVSASRLVVDIVTGALTICGMAGYRHDSPLSLGRLLRDAHGAALMVNNDRILANNAQMLLVPWDDA